MLQVLGKLIKRLLKIWTIIKVINRLTTSKEVKTLPNPNIHYNNQDIAQKAFFEQFEEGTKPLEGLNIETQRIKRVLPTGIAEIQTTDDEADCLFEMEDGSLLHIEFQSQYKKWDVIRFAGYHLHFFNKHKHSLDGIHTGEKIKTIVVYTAPIENEQIKSSFNTGGMTFKMDSVVISQINGENIFDEIKKKVYNSSNKSLTKKEEQMLLYNPFMNNNKDINERTLEIVGFLNENFEDESKFKLRGSIATLTHKRLEVTTLEEIWEVFRMGAVFEKFQSEENEKFLLRGARALKMIENGNSIKEVAEETGLTEEQVEKIAELNR